MRQGDISAARDRLAAARVGYTGQARAVQAGVAYDFPFTGDPARVRTELEGAFAGVDVVVQPEAGRAKRLLVADMDSTVITVECIDELADYAGVKPAVAAVTEAAMRGELDFAGALAARVSLLARLDDRVIARCLADRVRITPGAETLVRTMREHGARTVLVSGGFTCFADPIAARVGFHRAVANTLVVADGRIAGTVRAPIIDAAAKAATLATERAALGLEVTATMAVGDGANDLAMIAAAGMGAAFRAKPVVARAADARIDAADLTALLYAQGYPRSVWITD